MQNKNYRFRLEKYSGSKSKHTCPECNKRGVFVRYIDTETYNYISNEVGRCDRISECGYHYPPRQYFEKNSYYPKEYTKYKNLNDVSGKIKFRFKMDNSVMAATLNKSENNNLVKFLINRFDPQQVDDAIINYNVGTINKWPGATVFWQVSITNEIRTGKIILYNEKTGKRVKEPFPHIAWMHTAYLDINSQIKQCLFGEHLLVKQPDNTVGVVESEKTAIIASLMCPDMTWVSVGSATNLNPTFCEALTGRNVILYPDTDAHNLWSEKANLLADKMNITVSDDLQNDTEFVKNRKGADLADYFLYLLSSTDSNLQPV